jgi:hypothetical protein
MDGSDLAVVVFQVTYCCCALNGPDLAVVIFLDDVLLLWQGGSDLAIVLVVSLSGSDLDVFVFQMTFYCCGRVDLIWLLFFLFH